MTKKSTEEKPASSLQAENKATMGPNLRLLSEFPVGTIRRTMVSLVPPSDDLRRDIASDLDLVIPSLGPVRGDRDRAAGRAASLCGLVLMIVTAMRPLSRRPDNRHCTIRARLRNLAGLAGLFSRPLGRSSAAAAPLPPRSQRGYFSLNFLHAEGWP